MNNLKTPAITIYSLGFSYKASTPAAVTNSTIFLPISGIVAKCGRAGTANGKCLGSLNDLCNESNEWQIINRTINLAKKSS